MSTSKKAVLYIRANTTAEIAIQTQKLISFALDNGYQIDCEIYQDVGNVRPPLERTGLEKLLNNTTLKDVDIILAAHPDRVCRNRATLNDIKKMLKANKKNLVLTRMDGLELGL